MSGQDGAKAAVLEVARAAVETAKAAEPEQLTMLPPTRFMPGNRRHQELERAIAHDRAGRPPGAQNKATREIKALCLKLFGDPLVEDFRWAQHTPQTLARELGCTLLEAFDRLVEIRKDLRRFYYAPMAAIDADGNAVAPFMHLSIGGQAQGGPEARAPWLYAQTIEQNQQVAEAPVAVSHDPVSHGEPK